jgi:MoaA/NifB/PqqE/SkfB family radical SAM enzyme
MKIMKNAYLAVSYICNENCIFCPCSQKEKQDNLATEIDELLSAVDQMCADGISEITLSGGEPTLYAKLSELISYIQNKGIKVTVLSNGERFSSDEYIYQLSEVVDMSVLRVITTLHGSKPKEHEEANRTMGSFSRSVNGLKKISKSGARVIVKHCITKANYRNLLEFYKFCDSNFDQGVDIQFCSIDYCGMPMDMWENEKLLFSELKPFLEEVFDYDIEIKKAGNHRKLYCINMPLCACDPYYWKYMPRHREKIYEKYKDPLMDSVRQGRDNVGTSGEYCKNCKVRDICCGTYFTAYDVCKKDSVVPYL